MRSYQRLHWAAVAGCLIMSVTAQDPEAIRPVTIYAEDFESFAEGEDEVMGGRPLEGSPPWQSDPGVGVIASAIGGDSLPSRQIVATGGNYTWQSPWLVIPPGRLSRLSLDITARPGPDGFANEDNVLVYIEEKNGYPVQDLRDDGGPVPVFNFRETEEGSPMETLSIPIRCEMGPLREQAEFKITFHASATSRGAAFAFDDVKVVHERVAANVPAEPEYVYIRAEPKPQEPLESLEQPYLDFTITYASEVPLDLDSIDGDELRFFSYSPSVEFLEAQVSDGTGVEFNPPLESLVKWGHWDNRIELLLDGDVHFIDARYRVPRPANGWETFGGGPLFRGQEDLLYRSYSIQSEDGRRVPSAMIRKHLVAIPRPRGNRIRLADDLMVSPEDPQLDFVLEFEASTPIDISSLGADDIIARTSNLSWTQKAELVEIQEVAEDGRHVTAEYRLIRPDYGWPRNFGEVVGDYDTDGSFALVNTLSTAPVFSRFSKRVEVQDSDLDHISIALPEEEQLVSRYEKIFKVRFLYESETPLDLASFGDGDVRLKHSDVAGELVELEPSDDHRKVVATFAFPRERHSFPGLGKGGFDFPMGSVRNMEGTAYLGKYLSGDWQNSPGGSVRWDGGWHTVTADFQPISRFHSQLTAYRFQVSYYGSDAPINLQDIDNTHISLNAEGLEITKTAVRTANAGHEVEVDYVLSPSDGAWPDAFSLKLATEAVRDLNGGSHDDQLLAVFNVVGGRVFESELIGGFLIEGDPDVHRLSFLVDPFDWTRRSFASATLLFGGASQLLPAFADGGEVPLLEGQFVGLRDFENYAVVTYELERPEEGWNAWQANRLPFSLQLLDAKVLFSGDVVIDDLRETLPLLFSFEEWVRRLEEQAELPPGSLKGDGDGDGVDGLVEYALGGDLQERGDTATLKPRLVSKNGSRHLELTFRVRVHTFGLQAEIQHSSDGKQWRSVDDRFELAERREVEPGIDLVRLCSKDPVPGGQSLGMYRVAIAH